MTTDRSNTELAVAVEEALAAQLELGTRTAAAFLEANGASFALICRVLAEPGRRRANLPTHAEALPERQAAPEVRAP